MRGKNGRWHPLWPGTLTRRYAHRVSDSTWGRFLGDEWRAGCQETGWATVSTWGERPASVSNRREEGSSGSGSNSTSHGEWQWLQWVQTSPRVQDIFVYTCIYDQYSTRNYYGHTWDIDEQFRRKWIANKLASVLGNSKGGSKYEKLRSKCIKTAGLRGMSKSGEWPCLGRKGGH